MPSKQVGAHVGATHFPLVQVAEAQSASAPQPAPFVHVGAQIGGAHSPPVQMPDPQSLDAVHGMPSPHVGAHAVHTPFEQLAETQSKFSPQPAPFMHAGEQAGDAHMPPVQTPDPQLPLVVQGTPRPQIGEHEAQSPDLHTPVAQVDPLEQTAPMGHSGEHADAEPSLAPSVVCPSTPESWVPFDESLPVSEACVASCVPPCPPSSSVTEASMIPSLSVLLQATASRATPSATTMPRSEDGEAVRSNNLMPRSFRWRTWRSLAEQPRRLRRADAHDGVSRLKGASNLSSRRTSRGVPGKRLSTLVRATSETYESGTGCPLS